MSNERTARELLADADREKAVAGWADGMRCTIRLGRPVILSEMHQRGPFGRKRKYMYELDDRMPAVAVDAIYRALSAVQNEAGAKARFLEAQVAVQATTQPTAPVSDVAASEEGSA